MGERTGDGQAVAWENWTGDGKKLDRACGCKGVRERELVRPLRALKIRLRACYRAFPALASQRTSADLTKPWPMKKTIILPWALAGLVLTASAGQSAAAENASSLVRVEASRPGKIDPRLFGNFVELLDDVVPAMWAELLNDRSFEGVAPLAKSVYYDGAPNFCDREWDTNSTWSLDSDWPSNGKRSARLSSTPAHGAVLTQSGLAVKKGMEYTCSGFFRTDSTNLKITVSLKCLHPNGEWMTLASTVLPPQSKVWRKDSVVLRSAGESDHVMFELLVEGDGHVWADKLSLMPKDNQMGWRKDVIEAVKEVRPGLIRWGGSVCDPGEYKWKNGVGDRDQRVPFLNRNWGRLDANDVGIDEFCQFCELTGTEPLICLSFADGSQSAADLVEYCNGGGATPWGAKRMINGHLTPYRVKYWQVGNEISGDDPKYLAQFGAFATQIKRGDSGCQVLSSYPSQKLLSQYGAVIDLICPHHYTRDLAGCQREFEQLTKLLENTPGCAHIEIGVTEWNVSGGEWGLNRGRQQTLGTAILNARYLNVLMRNAQKVKLACRSNLANSFCGAIFETRPAGILRRPSYYAMQLYARHAKPVPLTVESSGENPDVFACASPDRKQVTIFAINAKTEPVTWTFKLETSGSPIEVKTAETLRDAQDAGQPDIMNHWDTAERIRIFPTPITTTELVLPPLSVTVVECGSN